MTRSFLVSLCALTLANCSAESSSSEDEGIPNPIASEMQTTDVGTVSQKLINPDLSEFTWVQGQQAVQMQHSSTHICALHEVRGNFQGTGESVNVWIDGTSGFYFLGGSSFQQGVATRALCARRSRFIKPQGWDSASGIVQLDNIQQAACVFQQSSMYLGDAGTMLMGISGNLQGLGEFAKIVQSFAPASNSLFQAGTCEGGSVRAWAASYFAGYAQTQAAKFEGTEQFVATSSATTNFAVDMARTDRAFCYLTYVTGKFRGSGEFIRLRPEISGGGVEVWRLSIAGLSTPADQRPRGAARCMRWDQR